MDTTTYSRLARALGTLEDPSTAPEDVMWFLRVLRASRCLHCGGYTDGRLCHCENDE